jgi:hypothetical protein
MARVLRFFAGEHLKPQAQILVAVKPKPVERFTGALAGWMEGEFGRFHLGCLPGVARQETAGALLQEAARTARAAKLTQLLYARLLPDGHEPEALLQENGFEILRSERFFQVETKIVRQRVFHFVERHAVEIPADWHTESIRRLSPESVLALVAPYRLMTPEEIHQCWRHGADKGFQPDLSNVLFAGREALGTLLGRWIGDTFYCDIRVVRHDNPRLRALANLCLFHHGFKTYEGFLHPDSARIRWLQFRGGEQEHRETANLAFRMGGKELPPRHVWAKTL